MRLSYVLSDSLLGAFYFSSRRLALFAQRERKCGKFSWEFWLVGPVISVVGNDGRTLEFGFKLFCPRDFDKWIIMPCINIIITINILFFLIWFFFSYLDFKIWHRVYAFHLIILNVLLKQRMWNTIYVQQFSWSPG